jgi:hypothetical protein
MGVPAEMDVLDEKVGGEQQIFAPSGAVDGAVVADTENDIPRERRSSAAKTVQGGRLAGSRAPATVRLPAYYLRVLDHTNAI